MLVGCGSSLPFLDKPENAIDEFMTQDSLMEVISRFDDIELDNDDIYSVFWTDILTSPSIKTIMLENVRSISYTISDVSENGDKATATLLITHLDISPVIDRAFEILIKKGEEMDASGTQLPEDEEEATNYVFSIIKQSIKEAAEEKKPSETYTKVRFDLTKGESGYWDIDEIPDDFIYKVLLMNFQSALEEGFDSLGFYSNYN